MGARKFINLGRGFCELTKAELASPEVLASYNEHTYSPGLGWEGLLKYRRIVLLAEAGSGKTRELEEKARELGDSAFFIPLEVLGSSSLDDALSGEECRRLNAWLESGTEDGWFFLDARDELKLTSTKLETALKRLATAIEGNLHRARILSL